MNTAANPDNPESTEPVVPDQVVDNPVKAGKSTPPAASDRGGSKILILILVAVSLAALLVSSLLWQRLSSIQEQLARQSGNATSQSLEARAMAKQAQDMVLETAARVAVFDARLSEISLQRTQLEDLMQSLSRSRDENLVVDIDSAIRLAQQQAQLTGSVEPLLAALKSAEQRVGRSAQPRLTPLHRALVRDIERIKTAALSDTSGLLIKLDELVNLADDLVIANAVASAAATATPKRAAPNSLPTWWQHGLQVVAAEARSLVRVSEIEEPDAVLLSPEQSFFLRENFKLKLLNARLGLLARQHESSRGDLAAASISLKKYFDASSRKTQSAAALLKQLHTQMKTLELPRVDDTLAALATAAAGR